jgi:UDP-N-acetylmuramoyl-tripeptide--D-alanyl-D-alanine ligase
VTADAAGKAPADNVAAQPEQPAHFWTLDRVAAALAPVARGPLPAGGTRLYRVWTDTRSLHPGDLFVALSGERFDAHAFVRDAVAAGAAAVVVSRTQGLEELPVPVIHVGDTRVALGALGRFRRRAWPGRVVGVVGTNGKTSTKELLRAALGGAPSVHATHGNLNNLVGVPQTLLAIPDAASVAVIEMGTNQPGEIAALRSIVEPDLTVVTSIAEEHLEGLGDVAGVMQEEMAATDGVAVAVVPAGQTEVVAEARARARRVIAAGLDAGELRATSWSLSPDGEGTVRVDGVNVHVPLRGVHNLRNAMLALAVAREMGVSMTDAAAGISRIQPPPMRSRVETIGALTLINDAYNSNPGSARAALELLAHTGGPDARGRQRVAVLGTMLELGAAGPRLHDEIARGALDAGIDLVAGVGEFAEALRRVGAPDGRVVTAPDADAIWPALSGRLSRDAIILLKGSRGVRLERLVPLITNWAQRAS